MHLGQLRLETGKVQGLPEILHQYNYMGSEVAVATEKVVHIFSLINTMFSQLKMTVMLTSLEIWSDQNKISSNGDADEVLQRFVSWKEKFLFQRSHDMAFLLIYRDHQNYVGATYHGMACDPKFAAGIALYPKTITLDAFSIVMVQLLGINLGLTYDDIYNCYCPGTTCIMNPQAIRSHGVKFFSSCSVNEFKHVVSQPQFECLQNQTVSKVVYQEKSSTCGNQVLEQFEECDCGSVEECSHKKCCHPENCTLIGNAECGSGICCDKKTCEIIGRGTICRESKDPCDFTEYCNGISEFCVPDTKAFDLEPCNNKTAFCYEGTCRDPDVQCLELFGKFARGSTHLCTQEVNFQADDYGNCNNGRCTYRQILCGKMVCHWTHSQIVPSTTYDIQYTFLGGHVCMSAFIRNRSVSIASDRTYAVDGTMCDEQKYCSRGACLFVSDYPGKNRCISETKCQGHGICNNFLNCQCDAGYAPPTCEPTSSSPGGSVDDGFWTVEKENRGGNLHNIGFDNDFLDMTPKAKETEEKIDKLKFIIIKNCCTSMDTISKVKRDPLVGNKQLCLFRTWEAVTSQAENHPLSTAAACPQMPMLTACPQMPMLTACPQMPMLTACPQIPVLTACPEMPMLTACPQMPMLTACPQMPMLTACPQIPMLTACLQMAMLIAHISREDTCSRHLSNSS
ncbi:A disintegrin and metallopeptidase domain 3 [Equus asinus]|uniref:A disintegrin and metallopeptidase domain 3 n=1 Tax=Equus asinus TaxID=9793 RepID=UPI0038F6243E